MISRDWLLANGALLGITADDIHYSGVGMEGRFVTVHMRDSLLLLSILAPHQGELYIYRLQNVIWYKYDYFVRI